MEPEVLGSDKVRAVVLAGGRSSRMGANKALLRLHEGGPTLIELVIGALRDAGFENPLLVTTTPVEYGFLGLESVPDELAGAGPLVGILSGLLHGGAQRILVVGCDMPLLKPDLLRFMASLPSNADAIVPRWRGKDGRVNVETLHTIYALECVEPIRRRLVDGDYRAHALFSDLKVRYVDEDELRRFDPELDSFRNVNTPEDLAALR
jgi:molybdopterin-guanine dinucleotide biosynthesis protein A